MRAFLPVLCFSICGVDSEGGGTLAFRGTTTTATGPKPVVTTLALLLIAGLCIYIFFNLPTLLKKGEEEVGNNTFCSYGCTSTLLCDDDAR